MSIKMDRPENSDPLDLMDLTVAFTVGKINSSVVLKRLMPECNFNLIDTICEVDTGRAFQNFTSSFLNKDFLIHFSQTFEEIKTRHKLLDTKRIFQRNLSKKNWFLKYKGSKLRYAIPKKCPYQVHTAHIREGIRRICHKLIPPQIIGNNRNHIKIFKALGNFLNTAKTEPFDLLNLVKNLDLESIIWIRAINDQNHKHILIGKFIKWLFQVFIAIIEKVFYMSHAQGEKVFIFIEDWESQKNEQLKLMCQRSALQLVGSVDEFTKINNRLCFIPKRGDLRPITIFKYTDDEMQLLRQIKALLHYLYEKKYQKPRKPFNEALIEIFKDCDYDNNRIFVVSCDINDAYGSILQGKLFDIIKKMFQTIPTKVKFNFEMVRKVKRYQVRTDDTDRLSWDPQKVEIVDKQLLLQVLKDHIFQTRVIYKKKVYNLNRGVSQGLIMSAILCKIYYTEMNEKYLGTFEKKGNLFNYVDDYLYVTTTLDFAKDFLDFVQKGISEFNCSFKKSKLKHNLISQDQQSIKYLGWKFNLQPVKIEPYYNSTRHSIYFKCLNVSSLEFKLKQLASLKIDKLILTKKINNPNQIFQNIELVCRRQAERCFALSSCLYDTQGIMVNMKSIFRVNRYLLNRIERLTGWEKHEKCRNRKIIEFIIWKSYFIVFAKRFNIFSNLVICFRILNKKFKKKIPKINT